MNGGAAARGEARPEATEGELDALIEVAPFQTTDDPAARRLAHALNASYKRPRPPGKPSRVAAFHVASNFVIVHFVGKVAAGETRKFAFESDP